MRGLTLSTPTGTRVHIDRRHLDGLELWVPSWHKETDCEGVLRVVLAGWPRTNYALLSGVVARRDDGSRRFSFSQVGGTAAGAFLASTWLPPSQSSAGAAASNFGISIGVNIGVSVLKKFLPDVARAIAKKRKKPATTSLPPTAKNR
jgi:hypothetical protein